MVVNGAKLGISVAPSISAVVVQAAARNVVSAVVEEGDHRCAGCGYGVSVYRSLPGCPMCGGSSWVPDRRMRSRTLTVL